jgi:parvulin-like peptidyl-prolyl isomerase
MSPKLNPHNLTSQELIPLLKRYHLWPQLCRALILDRAIASVVLTPEQTQQAIHQFCAAQKFSSEQDVRSYCTKLGLSQADFVAQATRAARLERFQHNTWAHKLGAYFPTRKRDLDQATYSLIRTQNAEVAQELYFRLLSGEQTWAELAAQYTEGPEAKTQGRLGPVPLSQPHAAIAAVLQRSQPGQVHPPIKIAPWVVLVRLEEYQPAQLDEAVQRRLLDELLEQWLSEEVAKLVES